MYLHSSTVSLKGRVACEMNTCDELLATEVLFNNILEPLNPPEIAALLSAFVFQVREGGREGERERGREGWREGLWGQQHYAIDVFGICSNTAAVS